MNILFTGSTIWSFRKELLLVSIAFLSVISLPFIAVIILIHTGINIVSDTLVTADPETNTITILDPTDESLSKEIEATYVWPVEGKITLEFAQSSGYQIFHTGIDIADPEGNTGTPVTTFMDGTVTYASEIFWGYGKHIIVDHNNGISSIYAHLDKVLVYPGQEVKIGDEIGKRGDTGWSTGPHLHFEIRVHNIPVNPRTFLGYN